MKGVTGDGDLAEEFGLVVLVGLGDEILQIGTLGRRGRGEEVEEGNPAIMGHWGRGGGDELGFSLLVKPYRIPQRQSVQPLNPLKSIPLAILHLILYINLSLVLVPVLILKLLHQLLEPLLFIHPQRLLHNDRITLKLILLCNDPSMDQISPQNP